MKRRLYQKKDRRTGLEKERDRAVEDLRKTVWEPDYKDDDGNSLKSLYNEKLNRVERLDKMVDKRPFRERFNINTAVIVGFNLVILIVGTRFEQFNVLASKVKDYIWRGKA